MAENGYRFVIALPGSLKYCRELIQMHGNEVKDRSECRLGQNLPCGKKIEVAELGFRMNIHLFYDAEKALKEADALWQLIEAQENDLRDMTEPPDRKLHYDKYFFINRAKDGSLGYRRNHAAIDEALSLCGYFLIAETDFTKTTAEILDIYRRRDVVEKCFDDLKNALDMHRLYVHSDEAAQGKAFCAFVALIIRSYMVDHLHDYMLKNKYTFEKLLPELKKVRSICSPKYSGGQRLLAPVSKSVRDIFAACECEGV